MFQNLSEDSSNFHIFIAVSPILDQTTRSLIKRAINAGLVDIDQVKKVVDSLMSEHSAALLDHPNIVRANDFAETSSKIYIVMEFVDGIDLHCVAARDGVMSILMAIDAVIQSGTNYSMEMCCVSERPRRDAGRSQRQRQRLINRRVM